MTSAIAPSFPAPASSQDAPAPSAVAVERRARGGTSGGGSKFYIPSLDGIRAFAVTLVFLGHAGADKYLPGGLGVTVFFFLSGFLITTLMRREMEATGRVDLRKFYMRRVLRIWPPMYLALGIAAVLCATGVVQAVINPLPLLSQALHVSNYSLLFGGERRFMPGMGVMWSLAVEEHFYLVFPVAFVFLTRRFTPRRVATILAATCVAVLAWRCVLVYGLQVRALWTYKSTDCRFDSILMGCIMGIVGNPAVDQPVKAIRDRKVLALVLPVAVIAGTLVMRDPRFRETFRYTIQSAALFPLFYLAVTEHRWAPFRWLNHPAMRALGTVSYSVYLLHYLFLYAARQSLHVRGSVAVGLAAAALTLLAAGILYYAVERPCARLRRKFHA